MKLLKKYTLRQSLVFLLLTFVVTFVFISLSAIYYIKNTQKIEQYVQQAYNLSNKFSELRYAYSQTLIIKEESNLNDKNIEKQILELKNIISFFHISNKTKKLKLNYEIEKIEKDFEDYTLIYKRINELKEQIYNNDNGLEKERIRIEREILDGDDYISENYLGHFKRIQRYEKQLFKGQITFDKFDQNYDKIVESIFKADPSNIYSKYVKSKFSDNIAEYQNILISKYSRQKEIGFTNNDGLNQEITEKYIIITSKNKEIIELLEDKQKKQIDDYILYWIITNVFILAILSLLAISFIRFIIRDLHKIKNALKKISQGKISDLTIETNNKDLFEINNYLEKIETELKNKNKLIISIKDEKENIDYKLINKTDKIGGNLIELKNKQQKRLDESHQLQDTEYIQRFVTNGITAIGKIMRANTNSINLLANNVLKGILGYLEAPQGAFYVYKNTDKKSDYVELVASYAYGKEKSKDKIIKLNEGLIGSVAVEKKHAVFNQLPEGYIYLSVGYGSIAPESLIILPLMIEDEIYGIIEIASFSKFSKAQEEFLLKLANEIAITISYVQINEKTVELLKQSNQQAEAFEQEKQLFLKNKKELKQLSDSRAEEIKILKRKIEQKERIIIEKVKLLKEIDEQ